MKKSIIVLVLLLSAVFLSPVRGEEPYSPFQFSFVYPLGTNGKDAGEYTNGASLNLLLGLSKNENNFALAGLSNVMSGYARGMQIAGISNHVGGDGKGVAIAGVANTVVGSYKGVMLGGIWNKADSGSAGVAIGGMWNFAKGHFSGLQLAGLLNIAGDIDGVQFAGLVNKAGNVNGVQFAALVNIAETSDCPIGLVNIIRNGEMGVALTYDLLGNAVVSFRSGGRYTYGILGLGFNHKVKSGDKIVTEAGYGVHIPLTGWLQLNNEVKVTSVGAMSDDASSVNVGYLLAPSFKLWRHFNLFGGPNINYFASNSATAWDLLPSSYIWGKKHGEGARRVYIGFQAGVQYLF